MPSENFDQLLQAVRDARGALSDADAALESARDELTQAQAVVAAKQEAVTEQVGVRGEARQSNNAAVTEAIAYLQSLLVEE